MRRVLALLVVTPLLANCSDSATPVAPPGAALTSEEVAPQGVPSSAVMVFGNPDAGTDFLPPGSHDQSLHGKDRIIPGTVVIAAGGTVTFQVNPGHRVAVYDDGTRPEDITVGPGAFVLDPTNRLWLQPAPGPTFSFTFQQPGRYLVICAITRHFVVANMYGWVIVQ
jgi:plastocyanin